MYLQVQNTSKTSSNQIRTDEANLVKDIKRQGWNIQDCSVSEIPAALVDTVYRGADGKNIPAGTKQYKTRAKSKSQNNLNVKNAITVVKAPAVVG
jgi:hypothetical protein